jgi:hypothetical protein
MSINFSQVNIWAVAVAAGATFMLGGLWYTALFGAKRVALCGHSQEKLAEMQKMYPPPIFFGLMLICYILVALVFAVIAGAIGVITVTGGVGLGLLLWVGPVAAVGLTGHIATDKPLGVFLIDASFQLVFLVMMGAIIGAWV